VTENLSVPLRVMDNHDPELLGHLLAAVTDVARNGVFMGGSIVERFEAEFARSCEIDQAIGVSSGTDALVLALRALGVGGGDEVIVPANSFIATAAAVHLAGATPRFADVDPETQLVTARTLERAVGPRVCGIIPVHLFGRTVDMPEVEALARRLGLWLVEDCAQAHGARFAGRLVGTWGDAAAFSFYPTKNLGAWGDAGAVVTNRADVAEKVRSLRSHGERSGQHREVGTTARLDTIQAAILERKLPHLDDWNAARRIVADQLREGIDGLGGVAPPPPAPPPHDHVYHQFVVRSARRDDLRAHLERERVATAVHYPIPIHQTEAFAALRGSGGDVAPVATRLASEIVSLPIFPTMTDEQVKRVTDAVNSFTAADRGAGGSRQGPD
jgi:dTDP-3-amino-3,4,6-trideoxy-alpha-D-glucose transaminase